MRPIYLLLAICVLPPVAWAEEKLSPEIRKALEETEARIKALKAAGQLPEGPEVSRTPAAKTQMGCNRLAVGAAAIIHFPTHESSPTGTSAGYGLSRQGEKVWLAELRLRFKRGTGFKRALADDAVNQEYRKRIGDCLKAFEGKLKGSDGRELILRLTDNASVPEHVIEIMGDDFRSHSLQYESDIDCPIVLHESLHLLGLSDEYPADQDSCRPAAPEDSIMWNHYSAVSSLDPQMTYEIEMCECEIKGTACWELGMKSDRRKCPPGSKSVFVKIDPAIRTSLNAMNTNERFVLDLGKMRESGFRAPTKRSVLYPAHMRAITEPGCNDVNEAFYACSRNAYRFSKPASIDELGSPALGCKPTPDACRWRSFKWLE